MVIYFATENPEALSPRICAELRRHGETEAHGLFVAPESINLLDPAIFDRLSDTIDAAKEREDLVHILIIIDTGRDAWTGNEDSSQEVARFTAVLKRLRDERGVTVIFTHHCGHGSERERGSYHFRANADFAWWINDAEVEGGPQIVECRKMRSFPKQPSFAFIASENEDGDYGVEIVETPAGGTRSKPRLTGQKRLCFEALCDLTVTQGTPLPAALGIPGQLHGVHCEDWRADVYARLGDMATDSKRRAFNRALTDLQGLSAIGVRDDWVWPAYVTDRDGQDKPLRFVLSVPRDAAGHDRDSPALSRFGGG
jgi:hypothetical protein